MRAAPSVTWGQRVSRHVGPAAPSPAHGQEESRVCKRPCSAGSCRLHFARPDWTSGAAVQAPSPWLGPEQRRARLGCRPRSVPGCASGAGGLAPA